MLPGVGGCVITCIEQWLLEVLLDCWKNIIQNTNGIKAIQQEALYANFVLDYHVLLHTYMHTLMC